MIHTASPSSKETRTEETFEPGMQMMAIIMKATVSSNHQRTGRF